MFISGILVAAHLSFAVCGANPLPSEKLYATTERQVFALKFIDTTAGELELQTLSPTTWKGRPSHHFRAIVRTVGLFNWIYPFIQSADIYFDREKQLPLFVNVDIKDRAKVQRTRITLNTGDLRGEELEESQEPGLPPRSRRKSWLTPSGAQSIFTVLHYLRLQELVPGKTITFPVSHDEKNGTFEAEVLRTETIDVPKGKVPAVVVRIKREFVAKFRNSIQDEPLLWLSNDAHKRLLRVEFKHRRGKVVAVLKTPLL